MTKSEFYQQLIAETNSKEHYELLYNCHSSFLDKELFDILITQLENEDEKIRFTAISFLIDKYANEVFSFRKVLSSNLIKLLFDKCGPVVDRAAWALNITGVDGLDKLIDIYATIDNLNRKSKIIWAIGRNTHVHFRKEETFLLLLSGLEHENLEIRQISMHAIMELSPIRNFRGYKVENYDFTEIYRKVKPVALYFSQFESENGLARIFVDLIANELKDKRD